MPFGIVVQILRIFLISSLIGSFADTTIGYRWCLGVQSISFEDETVFWWDSKTPEFEVVDVSQLFYKNRNEKSHFWRKPPYG